jgi:hypothetical protein
VEDSQSIRSTKGFKSYKGSYDSNKIFCSLCDPLYILPKVIYCYWDNLEGNILIKSHIDTWIRNIPKDWNVVIISRKNISQYVNNDFLEKYINLPSFRFSDFLRLYLLKNNGGVWMDAASIIINGNFLNDYYNEMIKNKYDITLYELKDHSNKYPYLENWFLMAPKNSKFITDLYNEFTKSFEMGFLNYKRNILSNSGIEVEKTLKTKTCNYTYLIQHAIIHYLLDSSKKYNINIKDSYESMFKVQKINNWNANDIINFIINNEDWSQFYAIKLIKKNRRGIKKENIDAYLKKLKSI